MAEHSLQRVGVIGAGVMGSGISQSLAAAGYTTTCTDISRKALERARQDAEEGRFGLAGAVARGKLSAQQAEAARGRIHWTSELVEAAGADLVIECIPEKLEQKVRLFRRLDRLAAPGAILASNT